MEKNKYTLYTIIILLVIFIPCSIYGTYMHITTTANLNHEFKFNNKLYFYENDKLLGTYECASKNCDYATYSNSNLNSSIINSQFAFINDGEKIYLYKLAAGKSLASYDEVQNIMGSVFKVRQDELWGAISISTTLTSLLECNFNSLEFKDNKFIVLKDNKWSIYQGQKELFVNDWKIKDFNEEFVIVTDDLNDKIYDYQNKEYIETFSDKSLSFVSDFILLKRSSNYYVYQFNMIADDYVPAIIGNFYYSGETEIAHNLTESTIEFYAGEELLKAIELSVQEND